MYDCDVSDENYLTQTVLSFRSRKGDLPIQYGQIGIGKRILEMFRQINLKLPERVTTHKGTVEYGKVRIIQLIYRTLVFSVEAQVGDMFPIGDPPVMTWVGYRTIASIYTTPAVPAGRDFSEVSSGDLSLKMLENKVLKHLMEDGLVGQGVIVPES